MKIFSILPQNGENDGKFYFCELTTLTKIYTLSQTRKEYFTLLSVPYSHKQREKICISIPLNSTTNSLPNSALRGIVSFPCFQGWENPLLSLLLLSFWMSSTCMYIYNFLHSCSFVQGWSLHSGFFLWYCTFKEKTHIYIFYLRKKN